MEMFFEKVAEINGSVNGDTFTADGQIGLFSTYQTAAVKRTYETAVGNGCPDFAVATRFAARADDAFIGGVFSNFWVLFVY